MFIDLRSDTVTRPTPEMYRAMMSAPLGDDVMGEDPTITKLEEKVAHLLGKEAGLFVPSGVMANQIGLGIHLRSGDQVMGHRDNHIHRWEAGAIARLWGATYREVETHNSENTLGILDAEDFVEHLQPDNPHYTVSRVIALENTLNRGGGRIFPYKKIVEIGSFAKAKGLKMHLDGARLWHAIVETGIPADQWASHFDTVSVCLSKGLGCPVGSVLVGNLQDMRQTGVRLRKTLGGGWRQAGILAGAGIFALEHHVERLAEDHRHAKQFAEAIAERDVFELEFPVETNLVWFRVKDGVQRNAHEFSKMFESRGIKLMALSERHLRAVFHLDVSSEQVTKAIQIVRAI